jgi:exo-beta-1,3-glucanase (GH17 family)
MPCYSFDLVVGEEFRNQGSIILEDLHVASDKADQLANELSQVKPELKSKGCAVRVTNTDNVEIYRTPLDPVPAWRSARRI